MFNLPSDVTVDSLLDQVHPAVAAHAARWQMGLDAYDHEGGFLDGGYLWKFAREVDSEFRGRQTQARYHNVSATLIDYYARKVFGGEIARETANADLQEWFENVDGAGTDLSTFMRHSLVKALAAGHVGILADKTTEAPTGPAKADERADVFLTRFLPTALLDWRLERDETLIAVKLREDVESLDLLAEDRTSTQVLLWDRDEWVRVSGDSQSTQVVRTPNPIFQVPLVMLRPFRSARWPFVGRALLGDAAVLVALYNRGSEQDTVLRDQAFSVFVVGLPANGEIDVEKAKTALGSEIGTMRALFTYGSGTYQTPDMNVPKTLEAVQQYLMRELYRMAHVPYDRDSREAESAESIRLQHEELGSVLAGVAAECQRVEVALCRLYFAWTSATPEQADAAFEAARVHIVYPQAADMFQGDPEAEIALLMDAMRAVPSPTFEKVIQKKIVARVAPSLDAQTHQEITDEIDRGEAERQPVIVPDAEGLADSPETRLARSIAMQDVEEGG